MYYTGCYLRYNWYVGAAANVWKIVYKKEKKIISFTHSISMKSIYSIICDAFSN
jgi:hypothetical protein